MLDKISRIAAHLVIWINIFLLSTYTAFNYGYKLKSMDCLPETTGNYMIMGDHNYMYRAFFLIHLCLLLPLLLLIIGKSIRNEFWSQMIGFTSLIVAGAIWGFIYYAKMSILTNYETNYILSGDGIHPFNSLLYETIILDRVCLGLLSLLFIYQIFALVRYIRRRDNQ
jgi:hypothetical protein